MAHDRQLESGEQEQSSDLSVTTKQAEELLDVLADWWAIYGQIYRDDPTAALAVAFREVLKPLKPEILHQACLIACRQSPSFRPKPGEIYAIAEGLMAGRQKGNRPAYLDKPKLSPEEREAAIAECGPELRKKLALNL